jgi:hypothetical protein
VAETALERVLGEELVIHAFAPLDGPLARRALDQVGAIWDACRNRLGLIDPIPGLPHPGSLKLDVEELPQGPVAGAQSPEPDPERQVVLRRINDVLGLSIAFLKPAGSEVRRPASTFGRRFDRTAVPGWDVFSALWENACREGVDALLGETRVFLGETARGRVDRPCLGEAPRSRLPRREHRASQWWRRSTLLENGFRVWDTHTAGDVSALREFVVIAPPGQDHALSAWIWSDGGSTALPPLARYLLHITVLRYEGRLLDSWQQRSPAGGRPLHGRRSHPSESAIDRQANLEAVRSDLEELHRVVENAGRNLAAAPIGMTPAASGDALFGADRELAGALLGQIDDHLEYNRIDLSRAVASANQIPEVSPRSSPAGDLRTVFVVHGRDMRLTARFFDFLHALGLKPMHWEAMVALTGDTSAHNSQIVASAPHGAQAVLVLLSPDDEVKLHSDLARNDDPPSAVGSGMQARPNVYYELGQAKLIRPNSTVIVEVGTMRPVGDVAGMNTIRFDGSARAIVRLVDRLETAGCPVDRSALADWVGGRFDDLDTFQRKP